MATYFHGAPEIQSDGLQTLYLMNPSYAGYPDAAAPANMVYQNSTMNYLNPMPIPHNLQSMMAPPQDYNLWTPAASNNPIDLRSPTQLGHHHPLQGLSLSLSPGKAQYSPATMMPEMKTMGCLASGSGSNGNSGLHSGLMGSKYLKAAQMLLDEIVIVQGGLGKGAESKSPKKSSRVAEADSEVKGIADLTTVERQEIQMKKSKLVSMLDEVEQRYKQYRHQIQLLISSFEAVAGLRSARTYTALALQTISKQFRRLRHTISDQIRATGKILGEECGLIGSGASRLRFVDHQLSQQRALQQLGTMQHNAWRPQRGLPEHAVSVLRAWLFEHFLHPYPKDADKHMLAKQTGLTRSQVSNWFINARVRLWKPMVEEMYLQEFKEQEENNSHEKASQTDIAQEETESKSSAQQERSPSQTEQNETLMQPSLKKTRMEMKPETMSNHDLLMKFIDREGGWENGYHGGGFSSYSIGEIGKSNHEQFAPRISGNCVSLTLGLPHDENPIAQLGKREEMSTEVSEYYRLSSYRTL